MRDTIEMAREAGLLTWLKPPEDVIERFKSFEALVRADEREALQAEVERLNKALTWEQNRAERIGTHGPGCHTWGASHYECLLREHERLKASIALDKMAENARELGLDYEPAPVQEKNQSPYPEYDRGFSNGWDRGFAAAQPAPVQEPVAWMQEDGEHFSIWKDKYATVPLYTTPPAPQPVPVKTYHDGKPWPVAPKPWVGLTDEEMQVIEDNCLEGGSFWDVYRTIEAKLKEKNHDQ